MILDLGLSATIGIFAYFVGSGWISHYFPTSRYRVIGSIYLGITISLVFSSWIVGANLSPLLVFPLALFFGLFGHFKTAFISLKSLSTVVQPFLSISVGIISLIAASFENVQLWTQNFRFRIGPDMSGWMSAAYYLCQGKTVKTLTTSIEQQMGGNPLLASFKPPFTNALPIDRIPSFRDQIAGEFLIGGHRTGLPGFQAAICKVTGASSIGRFGGALLILVAVMVFLTLKITLSTRFKNPVALFFLCITPALGFAYIAPILEGGWGSMLAGGLYVFVFSVLSSRKEYPIAILGVVLVYAYCLATYFDFLAWFTFSIAIFLSFSFVLGERFRLSPHSFKFALYSLGALLISAIPSLTSLPRQFREVVMHVDFSGWGIGNPPAPASFFGLFNWIPELGYGPKAIPVLGTV
ncbi:MAG: hypothetical protein NTX12_00980, partial [Actinobacteria bacterium]|nr:hypothetical protein [Actinomycetota bacterium]